MFNLRRKVLEKLETDRTEARAAVWRNLLVGAAMAAIIAYGIFLVLAEI